MTLRSFFRILWQQKIVIVAVAALVLVGSALFALRSATTYSSTASVAAVPAATTSVEGSGLDGFIADPAVLDDESVLQAAATALGMSSGAVADAVAGSRSNGGVITVQAVSPVPTDARQIADAYATALQPALTSQAQAYVDGMKAELDKVAQQLEEAGTNAAGAVAAAQSTVLTERYSAVFRQYDAVSSLTSLVETNPASAAVKSGLSTVTTLGIALLAGLLAGIGVALIRHWLDGRVIDAADVERQRAPVLGTVSRDAATAKSGRPGVAGIEFSNGTVAEEIRRLRTTIDRMHADSGGVVVVAGVERGAGATFLAANLATASARAGQSTIIVSGDLRHPDMSEYFGIVTDQQAARDAVEPVRGQRSLRTSGQPSVDESLDDADDLTEEESTGTLGAVNGRVPRPNGSPAPPPTRARMRPRGSGQSSSGAVARVPRVSRVEQWTSSPALRGGVRLVSTGVEGLSLLPSLVGPKEGPDALANAYVRDTVERLRAQADLVVIDAPPVLEYADAGILAGYGDELLLVAASRQTRTRNLNRALESVAEAGVKRVGVVINQARGRQGPKHAKPKRGDPA